MDARRGRKRAWNRSDRALSTVVGIVLLIGIVVIGAVAVSVAGIQSLDTTKAQIGLEQSESEMKQISHEINTIQYSNKQQTLDLQNNYNVADGPTLRIIVDDDEELNEDIGRVEQGNIIYEGGMAISNGRIIHSPQIHTSKDSSTIVIPTISGNSLSSQINGNDSEQIPITDPTANVTIEIQSEYYEYWYEIYEETNAEVEKVNAQTVRVEFIGGNLPELESEIIEHSIVMGNEEGGGIGLNEMPTLEIDSYKSSSGTYDTKNATFVTLESLDDNQGGGSEDNYVGGDLISADNIRDDKWDVTGSVYPNNNSIDTGIPTDELIKDAHGEEYSPEQDLNGGSFFYDGSLELTDDIHVTADSTLVVTEDLVLDGAFITVEEGAELEMHVHGDISFEGDSGTETRQTARQSSSIIVYTTGDIDTEYADNPEITGIIHGTDSNFIVSGEVEVYGSLIINSISPEQNHQQDKLFFYYDEDVEGEIVYEEELTEEEIMSYYRDTVYLTITVTDITMK